MRILLTGGSGFVGGHVARALAAEGHELRLLLRPTSDTSLVDDVSFERVVGDLRQADTLAAACEGIDAVVHAAAVLRAVRQGDFMRANREGTRNLAEAAVQAGVERFVYISSIAAQGPAPSRTPESPETTLHPVSVYGRSKAAGEEELLKELGKMQIAIIRPPMIYGPGDTGLQMFFWLARRHVSARLGDGSNLVDAIYGPDLADAIVAILRSSPRDVARYHIRGVDGPFTWNDLLSTLERVAGKRLWIPTLSPAVFHGFARCSEAWAALTRSEPMLDRTRVVEMRQPAWICDSTSLTDDTGWQAKTQLEDGMRETMSWYQEHGWA